MSIDELIDGSIAGTASALRATFPVNFQGLPDTAHGGSVLAVFDAVARLVGSEWGSAPAGTVRGRTPSANGGYSDAFRVGARAVSGIYRRRVPLETPLDLEVQPVEGGVGLELRDPRQILVVGQVTRVAETGLAVDQRAGARAQPGQVTSPSGTAVAAPAPEADLPESTPGGAGQPLPVSLRCFACGVENEVGLRVALAFDADAVWAECHPTTGFEQPAVTSRRRPSRLCSTRPRSGSGHCGRASPG